MNERLKQNEKLFKQYIPFESYEENNKILELIKENNKENRKELVWKKENEINILEKYIEGLEKTKNRLQKELNSLEEELGF